MTKDEKWLKKENNDLVEENRRLRNYVASLEDYIEDLKDMLGKREDNSNSKICVPEPNQQDIPSSGYFGEN